MSAGLAEAETTAPRGKGKGSDADAPRKVPTIDPKLGRVNYAGGVFKEVVLRLPSDFQPSDLLEARLFKNVQGSRMGIRLQKLDRVILLEADEAAMWTAVVAHAAVDGVTLSKPTRAELQSRQGAYFSDGHYRVIWLDGHFRIVRIKDNFMFSETFPNHEFAVRGVSMMYARPA